jgi:hypothetical protein
MAGMFDSLWNKASQMCEDASNSVKQAAGNVYDSAKQAVSDACDKVKEVAGKTCESAKQMAGEAYDWAESHVSSVGNAARLVVNTVKHPCNAIAKYSIEGVGKFVKVAGKELGDLVDEAAQWAKPCAKFGEFLGHVALPLKLLSFGEASYSLGSEGKWKKMCEFAGSLACGAGAVTAITIVVGATPVGWAALGVCAIGAGAAFAGDWIGGKIGDLIDNKDNPQPTENIVTPPETKSTQPQKQPAEEIRKAEPAVPLEIRKAIPAIPLESKKALMPYEEFKSSAATPAGVSPVTLCKQISKNAEIAICA